MVTEILFSPLERRLRKAGIPRAFTAWFDFKEFSYVQTCDLTSDDIPELIKVALRWCDDEWFERLDAAELDEETYDIYVHLPIHAWRSLAELKADDCADPLLSILNELARIEDEWSLQDFPNVLGSLGPTVIPSLINFADQTSNDVKARIVVVESLAKIADADRDGKNVTCKQIVEKFHAWLIEVISNPVQFESNLDAYDADSIQFNTAVLDGLLHLKSIESAELIEHAFSANQLDVGLAGDWSAVKQILNAKGLGLEMPDEPVNSMVVLRARMGFGIFSDRPLMEDGEPNDEALEEYYENAIAHFAASDEGKEVAERFGSVGWVATFLEYGASYFGETVDTLRCNDAREIVFDIIPRKVSTEAESADEIIFELRKFWEFVDRVHHCPEAKKIVQLFDNKSIKKLRSALSNPENFGMAKSLFMSGSQAGFDMTTQEGLDEFMMAYNASIAKQHETAGRIDLAEPPMQRIANPVKPTTPVMSATEKMAFDKKRKKQLAAKLKQKKKRK
jgi:hypothetical protein